jgi:hypothetical protein
MHTTLAHEAQLAVNQERLRQAINSRRASHEPSRRWSPLVARLLRSRPRPLTDAAAAGVAAPRATSGAGTVA